MTRPVDVVVIGAGLAGLGLAECVAVHTGTGGDAGVELVVVDPRTSWEDDRTWCWFDRPGAGPQHLVAHAWRRWRVSTIDGREVVHDGRDEAAYHHVRASAVHERALAAVDAAQHVTLHSGVAATAVSRAGDGLLTVGTDAGEITARAVVDTRPPSRERVLGSRLLQVFRGVEVTTDRPVFDPSTVGLMQRLTSDDHGLRFDYVLPTTTTTALVEATRFAPAPVPDTVLAADLDEAVDRATVGADHVATGRREQGLLPMGLPAPGPSLPGIVRAGVGGGSLRPATGYGFRRTLAWAQTCAARLREGRPPIGHPPDPTPLAVMDATFLRAVRAQPWDAVDWFHDLAARVPPGAFARFMSERATVGDLLRVVAALPPTPLARSLVSA